MSARLFLAIVVAWLLAGCSSVPLREDADEHEHDTAVSSDALSSIDCTESQETGYTNGTPFPITVVTVDGKKAEKESANAYYVMAQAAAAAGVNLVVTSGFRTMAEQQYLYNCYINCNCNNCNLAAKPGYSNHQSGHAFDLNTSSSGVYAWLDANAASFGFKRTVSSEPWHWEWWGGGPGGGPCGGHPKGYLDAAGCDSVAGWAQDPDAPNQPIDVHVYFGGPAGAPGAIGVATAANHAREDLCSAIGSCEHGFGLLSPYGLHDGQPHEVHAYGINVGSGDNKELAESPKTLTCAPQLASGFRRHVVDPPSYTAWGFSDLFDRMPATDAEIGALGPGDDWPGTPELMVAEGGGKVYIVDGTHKRHVPNPEAMDAWHFSWSAIQTWTTAQVDALIEGPPLSQRPMLVAESNGAVYVIDAREPESTTSAGGSGGNEDPGSGGSSGSSGGASTAGSGGGWSNGEPIGAAAGNGKDSHSASADNAPLEGGCAVGARSPPSRAWTLLALALLVMRRRRSTTTV